MSLIKFKMETNTYIDIQFKGNGFSPKTLKKLTDLPLEILIESGQIAKIGRYKSEKSPFGIALLKLENSDNVLTEWSKKLLDIQESLLQSKVEEIVFDIEFTIENFKNFTVTTELANNLSLLNAKINFNKIEEDNLEEVISKFISHISQTPSIPNGENLQVNLNALKDLYSNNQISPETTYGLIVFMLESLNPLSKPATEIFEKYKKEYHE